MSTIVYQEEEHVELCDKTEGSDVKDLIQYYLDNIHDQDIMAELGWIDPYLYQRILRIYEIGQMTNHEPIYICPECRSTITTNDWGEEYCETCGLVTRTHNRYVSGQKIHLPYGLK